MSRKISVPEWHAMAQAGCPVPMCIPIHGVSMYPLVRMDRDLVTILPIREMPRRGDIVLFADPCEERYVLHRVWKTEEGRVLTWGDNCDKPDGWIPRDRVWGIAAEIRRGNRIVRPDPRKGILLAKAWHVLGRGYRWAWPKWDRLKRTLKRGGSEDGKPE